MIIESTAEINWLIHSAYTLINKSCHIWYTYETILGRSDHCCLSLVMYESDEKDLKENDLKLRYDLIKTQT